MLFRSEFLRRIQSGEVTLAFRKWVRPSVSEQKTLKTPIGILFIEKVELIEEKQIQSRDIRKAGYASPEELFKELQSRNSGKVYRIQFYLQGPDPRLQLREQHKLSAQEFNEVSAKLKRLDHSSREGAWTQAMLELLESFPGQPSREIAPQLSLETLKFKTRVRKLKNLGLTISLGIGYKLSPRGVAVLKHIRSLK